jgi:hypothetical protein
MKERLKKEYTRRLRMMLNSKVNAKNKITAVVSQAAPVLRYSSDIMNWRSEGINKIDTRTRKILRVYKMLRPKADINRLYVKKERRRKRPCHKLK